MARLLTAGAEWRDLTADGVTAGVSTDGGTSTANPRSGAANFRSTAAGSAGNNPTAQWAFTGVLGTTYYARLAISVSTAFVAGTFPVLAFKDSATRGNIALDTSGNLILRNSVTQIGSTVAIPGYGQYFLLELAYLVNTGTVDYLEGRLNGVSFASGTSLAVSDLAPTGVNFANIDTTATGQVVDSDDLAVNDSTGASQTSWPGDSKVVLLVPASDSAVGTGWTLGTGTAISANSGSTAVKNKPPLGVADLTAGSDVKQIRNATSNASVNYDANLTTYTVAGMGVSDTVNVLVPMVATGAPVVTSAKAGTYGVVSNPAITNVALGAGGTAGAFWSGVAAGTYPTGWKWSFGTTTYAPTVTAGTAPVARITQVTASTRIADVCAMGIYVDYTPAPVIPPTPLVHQSIPFYPRASRPS